MGDTMDRTCVDCGGVIPGERVEALPDCTQCVGCAAKRPKKVIYDPEIVCAKASPSGQNGWSPTS
jgi:hypothetical protein